MIWTILILIAGLALVVWGSDLLVDGSSAIARRSGVSEFVIGLTIVGIGTSTPEMVVSWIGAFKGLSDIAVGNIIGSNIFNTFLILGVTALILPMTITRENIHRDIPVNIFVTLLLVLLAYKQSIFHIGENSLGRLEGFIFLALFAYYLYSSFKYDNGIIEETEGEKPKTYRYGFTPYLLALVGLSLLVFGGRLFVNSATQIAKFAGWSDKFIAITILAGGTSLPELATCIVAAFKKKGQLALGNILGSNISNILLVLGGSAVICPLSMSNISNMDFGFVVLAAFFPLAAAFTFSKNKLDRIEGVALVLLEALYMYLLISEL